MKKLLKKFNNENFWFWIFFLALFFPIIFLLEQHLEISMRGGGAKYQ
jgi:hypothetical protein